MRLNAEGRALLKASESFVGHAYADPASPLAKALQSRGLWQKHLRMPRYVPEDLRNLSGTPWTIGYGFTTVGGVKVKPTDVMSLDEAEHHLDLELDAYERGVAAACTVTPNENEFSAMVCFAWNVGLGGFKGSTVLKAHNRGDKQAAARAFSLWNKAGGKVMAGLTRRRAEEAALYLQPTNALGRSEPKPDPIPQQVQPEGPLAASPMMITSAAGGTVATVSVVAEGARGVREIKDSLGDMLPWFLAGVAVAACAFMAFQRYRQRRGGWA